MALIIICICHLIVLLVLKVQLFKHTLVIHKGLVVSYEQCKEARQHSRVATQVREQAQNIAWVPDVITWLLRLTQIDGEIAKFFYFDVLCRECRRSWIHEVQCVDVELRTFFDKAFDEECKVTKVNNPIIKELKRVVDHRILHRLWDVWQHVCGEALCDHGLGATSILVSLWIKVLRHDLVVEADVCNLYLD